MMPIHYAARSRSVETLSWLVEKGAKIDCMDSSGWMPIHYAALSGSVEALSWLVEKGAKIDCVEVGFTPHIDINAQNTRGQTALHIAAELGNIDIINVLMKDGKARVDICDYDGNTPLHVAAAELSHVLLESLNIDDNLIQIANLRGWMPIHVAARHDNCGIVEMINPDRSLNLRTRQGQKSVHIASRYGSTQFVSEQLFKQKSQQYTQVCDDIDDAQQTPIHLAVRHNHVYVVRVLLQHHSNCSRRDKKQETSLHKGEYCSHCGPYMLMPHFSLFSLI